MRNRVFLLVSYMTIAMLCIFTTSCSKEDEPTPEEIRADEMNEEYNKLKAILPGTWEGYEYYNDDGLLRPTGWRPISEIYWDTSYTFNSDGTYIRHDGTLEIKGTYRLEKNSVYIADRTRCKVILYFKRESSSAESGYAITLDGDYLRLKIIIQPGLDDTPPSIFGSGEAIIRYKKK